MNKQSGFIIFAALGGVVLMAVVMTFIYWAVAQPLKMSGSSMNPTIVDGEYFLVNKLDKNFQKGDVVVFRNPNDEDQDFIKRIIALPGEKVVLKEGKAYINGTAESGVYLLSSLVTNPGNFLPDNQEKTVPEGEYFLVGDNREHSSDSRTFGFVKKDKIIGKYWFSYSK